MISCSSGPPLTHTRLAWMSTLLQVNFVICALGSYPLSLAFTAIPKRWALSTPTPHLNPIRLATV